MNNAEHINDIKRKIEDNRRIQNELQSVIDFMTKRIDSMHQENKEYSTMIKNLK
jgi:prefoldin subunit 5